MASKLFSLPLPSLCYQKDSQNVPSKILWWIFTPLSKSESSSNGSWDLTWSMATSTSLASPATTLPLLLTPLQPCRPLVSLLTIALSNCGRLNKGSQTCRVLIPGTHNFFSWWQKGLCRCNYIKILKMERLPWITWWTQSNHKALCKRDTGRGRSEEGKAKMEARG